MESCHSVLPPIVKNVPHPPPYCRLPPKVYSTLGHLVDIIEQLSSRGNLSSLLRDIVADDGDAKSPSTNSRASSYIDLDPGTIIKVAQILRKLNSNCSATMATMEASGTKTASSASLDEVSGETPGTRGGERARKQIDVKHMTLSKQDSLYLVKKIKDFEQKCKPLQEKNKKFLERNIELTTQNRTLRDQIRNVTDENKKLKENLDQCRRKCGVLSRQLNQERLEKGSLEERVQELEKIQTQVTDQEKTITNLKQAALEKDRRMEVLQHRKKRRLRVSAEHLSRLSSPCSITDDERSLDSDISQASLSTTASDEDLLEDLPHDDLERVEKNYKKLMKEHLALQKSMAQLQGILGWGTDPQRYTKKRLDFETDLFVAQCKIENLEECLERYKDWDQSWVLEKDQLVCDREKLSAINKTLVADTKALEYKSKQWMELRVSAPDNVDKLSTQLSETRQLYEAAREQVEDLEFLVLETQEQDSHDKADTVSASTSTHDLINTESNEKLLEKAKELEELRCSEAALRLQLNMGDNMQQEYRATIRGLEEKLEQLLKGQGSEVTLVMSQLRQAEQHVGQVESTMRELQSKVVTLQEEKAGLSERLKQYRGKLDAQEYSLALTREEREELLQVKRKTPDNLLSNRLKLAEVGHDSIRERSLERERSHERITSPLASPRSPRCSSAHDVDSFSSYAKERLGESLPALRATTNETQELFEKQVSSQLNTEPVNFDTTNRHSRTNSVPVLSSDYSKHFGNSGEVDRLQRQITELQDENDVLKYELAQKGHGDSDASSGSDSEDSRLVELRETIEQLRERVQSSVLSERQYKDRVKLAEKHISELELSESVLRDRVEEGNADCDKLRKQIVRLQKKIRELKEVTGEKELSEQALMDKVKYLEETETSLSQKNSELEANNQILKQRLELKDELDDAETVAGLKERIKELEKENNNVGSRVIDLEEANEILRDNWKKVADEEADRRECLEEKVKVLECANNDLKSKLKEQENDLDLSACQSIASEINEDAIEQLNDRIRELESELQSLREEKDEKIETLQESIGIMKENEVKLSETLAEMENSEKMLMNKVALLEKSEDSQEVASTMLDYQDNIDKLRSSQEDLIDRLDSMEDHEDGLKEKILHMEKTHEKQLEMLEREIAEYQQQEDDLCARTKELEESENRLLSKMEQFKENEMNLKNKIEELENRETSLTIGFSKRVEELEKTEKEIAEKFYQKIQLLEDRESNLKKQVNDLENENGKLENRESNLKKQVNDLEDKNSKLESEKAQLVEKISLLEKHEKEMSEKDILGGVHMQENSELVKMPMNGNSATVELLSKVEGHAKVEMESSKRLSLDSETLDDIESIKALNISLQEEIKTLNIKVKESEKDQKLLTEKCKKQERRLKKSQRTDNIDDYDTLAREAVTYKIEVEQLRTENTDLYERVSELDESEKSLLEENESLKCEIKAIKSENSLNEHETRETELEIRIKDLEEVKQNLTDEISKLRSGDNLVDDLIVPVKQNSVDSAYESSRENIKELSDKQVGTDDFLEGVMCGQEQGKPVSSMFERIQVLETENQEQTTKLANLTATDSQVRQLSDKVKALEENEDSLMERVMELEDEEDRLKRELIKAKQSISVISDLEEEIATLQETEKDLKSSIDKIELENLTLKKTMECSGIEKGDIAIMLAKVQKSYEDEKKKVESLLKGEAKYLKSVASQKKTIQDMEDELAATQEKLEELQTEYENKLSEKDENEKLIKEELTKIMREKETIRKKLQEFEISNGELEDEIEACKISESRMFHKHQQLITQNQELELKLEKLLKLLPYSQQSTQEAQCEDDGAINNDKSNPSAMSENPEVISETPLTSSIFTDTELELLRSKTPDTELLGSVPLDMLRKMQEFDEREKNYQHKVQDLEQKSIKFSRKVKLLQGKEKDLKQEIKELQMELFKYRESTSSLRESTSSLRASTSSLDLDRSMSDEGMDSDNQSSEGLDDIFKGDEASTAQYENMSHKQLVLTVKLFEEKQNQDIRKITELEDCVEQTKDLLQQVVGIVTSEPMETFIHSVEAFKETTIQQNQPGSLSCLVEVLDSVTSLRRRLVALQGSEERLRISLAENEIATERLTSESRLKIQQLEAQIQVLAKLSDKYPPTAEQSKDCVDTGVQSDEQEATSSRNRPETEDRATSHVRNLQLGVSETVNVDVAPTPKTSNLAHLVLSETVRVDVPPHDERSGDLDNQSDVGSEVSYPESPARMMDKAEDVLRQRIRELEKLEKHLKKQVTDIESDREELHEIARKDKNIIHEQNVLIRELQLSQRNLQAQIKAFETSENTLYSRLDELENELENKSDHIRHLEILEGRLKDLVKQYKLDERILQTKSDTLESSIKEMSSKEQTLKQKVENLESEKTAFSERSEYLQMRLKELENAEIDLAQRSKNQENIMQSLQNTVIELETFGANAQSRVVELEQINFELQQRLHHAMTENSPLSRQLSNMQQQCDAMESELSAVKDSEIKLRQDNEALIKNESGLQQQVKILRIKEVELDSKVRDLEETDSMMKDRLSKLQRSENTLKYRVQELENSGIQAPSDLSSSLKDGAKLPRTLEGCQRRVIMLQATNAELQSRLQDGVQGTGVPGLQQQGPVVSVASAEYQRLQTKARVLEQTERQMEESDRLNSHLQETVEQLREGKDVCGHEVEIEVLRSRLDQANESVKILKNQEWVNQGQTVLQLPSQQTAAGSRLSPSSLPEAEGGVRGGVSPAQGVEQEMMVQTTTGQVQSKPPSGGQMLSRDQMISDLLKSLEAPRSGGGDAEDRHWHEIESRMEGSHGRGSETWINIGKATSMYAANGSNKNRSHNTDEVLEVGVILPSESESQTFSQNDMFSGRYKDAAPTQLQRLYPEQIVAHVQRNSTELHAPPPLPQNGPPGAGGHLRVADSFGESLYVPSSAQDSLDDYSDQVKEMFVAQRNQPAMSSMTHMSAPSMADSMPDSGRGTASISMATSTMTLRERIAHIERQLSARESDSAREFNSEIDLTSWKAKVHESGRKLENSERENKAFKDEINKLEKDLEEKTRLYVHLETFLNSVESLLKNKNIGDAEMVSRIEQEVDRVRSGVTGSGNRPEDISLDPAALSTELTRKDRELSAKKNEVDSLMRELRQWQQECRTIEDMRSNALDSLRGLEVEISDLQLADKQLKELKDEYNTLRGQFLKLVDAYKDQRILQQTFDDVSKQRDDLDIEVAGLRSKVKLLEGQIEVLNGVYDEKSAVDDKNSELREKVAELEKVEIEKNGMEKNLTGVTKLLNDRMKKVEKLTSEVFDLRKKMLNTNRDNYKLRQETVHDKTATKNNSGKKSKQRLGEEDQGTPRSAAAATLRSRVVQLTNLCSEKDILIKKLVQELKKLKAGSKPSTLLEEICRINTTSDYNHNQLARSSSQSSLESGEHMSYVSDTELLHDSSRHYAPRPRSADAYHHRHVGYRHSHHGTTNLPPRIYASRNNSLQHTRGSGVNNIRTASLPHLSNRQSDCVYNGFGASQGNQSSNFVAVADYDPSMFSMSGHPRLELSLKEGDFVKVMGNMDENGYYEAEVNGRVGLVPASYLQPALPHRIAGNRNFVPQHLNASPERIAQMYHHLHSSHQPDTHVPFTVLGQEDSNKMLEEISKIENLKPVRSSSVEDVKVKTESYERNNEGLPKHQRTNSLPSNSLGELPSSTHFIPTMATGPPQAPSNFHVEKIVGNSSLMLAWQPVSLDGNGCNNGLKVTGYRVFKNNKILVHPRGPLAAKAIIENVDIHTHHRLGIQTVTGDGQVSQLSEIMYEGVEEATSEENSDTESEMDMSSMLDMDAYSEGQKRMFMGVYDYDPTKNSPQDHPSCELAFNAGDTITVYGRQRSDGFYHGEINNLRGLVPAFFIEEIPQAPPRTKKNANRARQQQQKQQQQQQDKDNKSHSDKQPR